MSTLDKKVTVEQEFDDKILVVEDGAKFIKQLRAEAKRQKAIKEADMMFAAIGIESVPQTASSAELSRLADEMEIIEDDDN